MNPEGYKVLVIYTGGTIGMKKNDKGKFVPVANFLFGALKQRFEDTAYTNKHVPKPKQHDTFFLYPMENGKHIEMKFVEYDPLIDSSNMCYSNWIQMATSIKEEYDNFDGFVVLHGTDTMAYTASALSFICHNLGKPIILTGSQIPVSELRSDGYVNFVSALVVAANYSIPEVMLCFDAKVYRGCRAVKVNAEAFAAFDSPNMAPLVKLGFKIKVESTAVQRPKKMESFFIDTEHCPDVAVLHLLPSMPLATVKSIIDSGIKGLIIRTYGAGNAPNGTEFIQLLMNASKKGILIANVTQCQKGSVGKYYAVAEGLQKANVVPCGDMTVEAAITKLMFLLGKEGLPIETKRKLMGESLRGEITIVKEDESALNLEIIDKLADILNLSTSEEIVKLRDIIFPNLMCGAAKLGDIETLKKLKNMGGDLSSPNQDGRTPLHVACREGLVPVVEYLLNEGASVHQSDSNNNTPLMDAIYGNRFNVIPLLIDTGATIHIRNTVRLATELCCAADLDDVDTLRSWKIAGADFNYTDYDKRTALHVAFASKRENSIKLLLDNGADPDAKDQSGRTPRDHAKEN